MFKTDSTHIATSTRKPLRRALALFFNIALCFVLLGAYNIVISEASDRDAGTSFPLQYLSADIPLLKEYRGMKLIIKDAEPWGATLRLENKYKITVYLGFPYYLYTFIDDSWVYVDFTEHAYFLLPLIKTARWNEDIDFNFRHGGLKPGKYRIVKEIIIGKWGNRGLEKSYEFYLYADFIIG